MKIVFVEPLGIPKHCLESLVKENLPDNSDVKYYDTRVEDSEALIERSKDADIVVLSNLPYKKEVMSACPHLKMIDVAFTGVDHVDIDYCRENNILVSNCSGYSTSAVADLVFGMLISLYRNIIPCNEVVRDGGTKNGLVGLELEGKKFGIVGTGEIGVRTGKIAQAFGCDVYAFSRTVKPETGFKYVDLDTLMSECDIVSLHVPLNSDTIGMINKDKLSLMKNSAVLINTSRGPVVDNSSLADLLNSEKIAGACIDVFETEPPIRSDHPLLHAKNTVLTPHVAFATDEALAKRAVIAVNNIRCFLNSNPINIV